MLLYNSSNLNLGLRITLVDQFTAPAARIKNAFKDLKDEKRLFEANARAGRDMYTSLATAGAAATLGLSKAYLQGAKFEYKVRGVAAASEATSNQFDQMKRSANALGGETMFKPSQVADAMEMLAKAGYNANEVLTATKPIINLAGAAMEDLALSADIGISTMYQFGMQAKDMGYISDLLTQAALKSNVGLRDLGESLKYASATAVDLGQNLPTLLALIMTLGNAGMKGSMAGVGIENMYRYMSLGLGQFAKTGRAAAWEKVGMDPKKLVDAKGNLKPIVDILTELSRALSKFGDVDQQNLLFQIFGVRGKRPPSKFIQDLGQVAKHMKSLEMAGGKAENMLKFMMQGPEGNWLKLLASLQSMANSFTEVMAPIVIPFMQMMTWFFRGLSKFINSPIGGVFTRLIVTGLIVKTVAWGVRAAIFSISLALSNLGGTILGIRTAWVSAMAQMKAATMQLAGITTMVRPIGMAGGMAGSVLGYTPGAGVLRQNNRGMFYKAGTGRFVSKKVAERYMARYGAKTVGSALLRGGGPTIGRLVGGAFGGPVGWAITIASFLPLIYSALRKNTDATEDSNDIIRDGSSQSRKLISMISNEFAGLKSTYIRQLYNTAGFGSDNTDFVLARKLQEYLSSSTLFRGREFYDYSNPDQIHIYMDGKLVKTIQREMNKNINAQLNFGI